MAFVLCIGVATGTYSTIYIAGSLIVDWAGWRDRWVGKRKKAVAKA
jgi:preprotein translocase subunit SecF